MYELPKYLKQFHEEAKEFFKSDKSQEVAIDFTENFYEFSIPDQYSNLIWRGRFKITPHSELVDSFCSCPEEELGCVHITIAFLYIHQHYSLPLHLIFSNSIWYILFHSLYISLKKTPLTYKNEIWTCSNNFFEILIHPSSNTQEKIFQILNYQNKLSNFSSEELSNWENESFSYTDNKYFLLSIWYDLAKFIFLHSLKTPYKICFLTKNDNFPFGLTINFNDIFLSFSLNENIIYKCIPLIENHTIDLQIWPKTKKIISIKSNLTENLIIEEEFLEVPIEFSNSNCFTYKDIKFLSNKGFLLNSPSSYSISLQEIPLWLVHKKDFIKPFLHSEIKPVSYKFFFDIHANLHCLPFLFEPEDLKLQGLVINTHLAFINNKGFFKVSGLFDSKSEFIIHNQKLENYLDNHPNLFSTPGFEIFLTTPGAHSLTFSVNDFGSLLFFYPNNSIGTNQTFHFGKWVYHENIGFLLNQNNINNPIDNGTIISKENISNFINEHKELLKTIPNFFCSPINFKDIEIEVKLTNKTKITLTTFLRKENSLVPCKIFQQYGFIENEGFFPLLLTESESPTLYPKELSGTAIASFYNLELKKLNNPIIFTSPSITPSENLQLFLTSLIYDSQNQLLAEFKIVSLVGSISLNDILTATKTNKEFLFSSAGYIYVSDSSFKFISYLKEKEAVTHKGFYLSVIDILKIDALFPILIDKNASKETHSNFIKIKEFCIPHPPELSTQHKHLRPYQKNGLLWLWFLYHNGISGLLCDEMGLGKTHQAMSLINTCALISSTPKLFLVVCPTSVLMHWVSLLKNYFSNLPTFFFHTKTKKLALPNNGVIITSYGMLRHQYKLFYEKKIEIAIFDEIQLAKNKNSQIHKILSRLDAKMKLGLTGTPIENNVQELKALFDIVIPDYLPPDPIFKSLFSRTTNKDQNAEKNRILKLIKPFILRRTKNSVLPELPNKVEKNLICYLSEEQKQLYTQLLKQESYFVSELLSTDKPTSSYIHIFALLNHLKQICDHPAVFMKNPTDYLKHSSGKWNIFVDLLDTNLANDNKIVIFSQYLSMIDIITTHLKHKNINFALIHGKSLKRQQEVDRFQNDPNCKVFVGSLLASGTGINLTAGNVVIMYDRWWNPAKENQALDRVHRIGQKNTVFIYRLITANTVEDKINLLIEKKSDLFNEIIPNNETGSLKMLNKEDLLEILNYKSIYEDDEIDL